MEEGSVVTGAGNGMASDSRSLAVEIKMANMPEDYGGGGSEKLMEASESESDATSIMEKGSCCRSWVVEIEKMLEDANFTVETVRRSRHSIYRVPQFIKDMTNSEAYSPRFVSLGPLHHGEPHLLPMEEHKRRAVVHMVKRSGKPLQEFVAAIDEVADELQAAYNDLDDDKWRGANKSHFVEVMVTDGCFLLEWIRARELGSRGEVNKDYEIIDPIFSNHSGRMLLPIMRSDMIRMENQLPLVVLQRLRAVEHGPSLKARHINSKVLWLLNRTYSGEVMDELGLHFLDIFHKSYCGTSPQPEESDKYDPHTPCAVELADAGIRFKKSDTDSIHDVHFKNGVLSMPLFQVGDSTEVEFLNLMAFERLMHPDSNLYVTSYICFLDQIIESERDVALLSSEGAFENFTDSDKKVVEMFNTLTTLGIPPMSGSRIGYMNWKVNSHCKKRRNKWRARFMKWRASFMETYLGNPWLFTSMVAAIILLVATLLQTVYTVVPFYTKG